MGPFPLVLTVLLMGNISEKIIVIAGSIYNFHTLYPVIHLKIFLFLMTPSFHLLVNRKQLHLMQEQLEAATSCSKKICKKIIALNARFDKKIKKAEEIILEKCIRRGKVLVKRKSYMPKDAEIKNSVPSCYRRFTITKLLLGLSLAMI